MKIDWQNKRTYERHSAYSTRVDNKKRQYFFEIENLDSDYEELKRILESHPKTSFDFVASCIEKDCVGLRIFSDNFTGRFLLSKEVSPLNLKQKLISDGYTFVTRGRKSGPLCLNDDFSEPFSAKKFRFFLPLWELKMWFLHDLFHVK